MKEIDDSDKELIQTTGTFADEIRMFFKRDTWTESDASYLIAGVLPVKQEIIDLPNKYNYIDLPRLNGEMLSDSNQADIDKIFGYQQSVLELYQSKPNNPKIATPQHFVEWANEKGITIPWLAYAIEIGFYKNSESRSIEKVKPIFDKASSTYPPELDFALKAWKAVTESEGKGKPKARIKKWLDHNTNLSNEAKERISIVANWDKLGGATRTD